jgi:hypothetical protein
VFDGYPSACIDRNTCKVAVRSERLLTFSGSCSVQLCEALGAIGGLQAGALLSLLPDILKKLRELKSAQEPSAEQVHTKVCYVKEESLFPTLSCMHL